MFESDKTTRTVIVYNEVGQTTEIPNAAGWSITDYGTLEVYGVQDESLAAFAQSAWATVGIKPEPDGVSR